MIVAHILTKRRKSQNPIGKHIPPLISEFLIPFGSWSSKFLILSPFLISRVPTLFGLETKKDINLAEDLNHFLLRSVGKLENKAFNVHFIYTNSLKGKGIDINQLLYHKNENVTIARTYKLLIVLKH